uniref:Uncharacterized protein n=1 Tax=Tetranychus urticae TaxID=32264 RepID=T1KRW5_TETUR
MESMFEPIIPSQLLSAMVKRRIAEVNAFYENKTLSNTTRAFALYTNQSLTMFLDLLSTDSCTDSSNDATEFYKQTVYRINEVYEYLDIDSYDRYTVDTIYALDIYNISAGVFKATINAYISDMELVRDYAKQSINRVNMGIVKKLKTLSDEMDNLFHDDSWRRDTNKTIGYKAIDQGISRLRLLLKLFSNAWAKGCSFHLKRFERLFQNISMNSPNDPTVAT